MKNAFTEKWARKGEKKLNNLKHLVLFLYFSSKVKLQRNQLNYFPSQC